MRLRPNPAKKKLNSLKLRFVLSPSKNLILVMFLAMGGGGNHKSPLGQPVAALCTRMAFKNLPEYAQGPIFALKKALHGGNTIAA